MKEPIRLCDGDELPSTLRDAFRALEREVPSADVVARVQHTLQALPAATAGSAAASTLVTGKLLTLGTLLVAAVASLVALRSEPASTARTPEKQPSAVMESSSAPAEPPTPAAESAPGPASAAPSPPPERRTPAAHSLQREARAVKRIQRPEASTSAPSFAHARGRPSKGVSTGGPAPIAVASEVASAPANEDQTAPAASAPDPDAAGAQASEARMLAQAKRLAVRDPTAALRQVEALASQFPAGLFMQERELLAIQLHRQLGHTALAEQLARQFQQRYPRSLYRRALPP